jgi:lysozyme
MQIKEKMVDVSHWDEEIDWKKVKASGINKAMIKATEGLDHVDHLFVKNWTYAKEAGLQRGAYHFFHPAMDPIKQANFFLKTVGTLVDYDMPCCIDWETHDEIKSSTEIESGKLFLETIHKATKKTPIIYSGGYYMNELGNPISLQRYPLWLADYRQSPHIPKPWTCTWAWQYTDKANVPGIKTQCDMSIVS